MQDWNSKPYFKVLCEAARAHTLVPLIGAGVSQQASSITNTFPNWSELITRLIQYAIERGYITVQESDAITGLVNSGEFLLAAEGVRGHMPTNSYVEFLREQFDGETTDSAIHEAIWNLKCPIIMTTNYDTLLEDAYAAMYRKAPHVVSYHDAAEVANAMPHGGSIKRSIVFKLHGTIDAPETVVLTNRDYQNLVLHESGYRAVISAVFISRVVLMIGYSMTDPELRALLSEIRESLFGRNDPDYMIVRRHGEPNLVLQDLYRKEYGIETIEVEGSDNGVEFLDLFRALGRCIAT